MKIGSMTVSSPLGGRYVYTGSPGISSGSPPHAPGVIGVPKTVCLGDITDVRWHQWTTPRGRTYTQGPKNYPV